MFRTRVAALAALVLLAALPAGAQSTTQSIAFDVQAINRISVTGSPSLTISTATAGDQPDSVSYTGATWAVTTNQNTRKVTAQLGSDMPAGLTLKVTMAAPSGASGVPGAVLSGTATDVVTAITTLNASALAITYTLIATPAAGVVSGTRIVTYTVAAGT